MSDERELFHVDPASPFLTRGGHREFIAGINYVPSYEFGNFWEDFREEHVRRDMERIASMQLNAVRVPIFWHYWEPREGEFNPEMARTFRRFLEILEANDLYVLPWFLVGICGWLYYHSPKGLPGPSRRASMLRNSTRPSEKNPLACQVT